MHTRCPMASVPFFNMLSMQNRHKTSTHLQALDQPVVELRATCTELGLEFVVPTPFKAPETHSLHGLTVALGTALLSDKAFNLGTATGADRFNELCRERSSILAERHDFYYEVQQRFEGMAQNFQLMQRDYYREIDFLREQISRLRKQPEHEVPEVTFLGRYTYKIPAWEDIVDVLDERRMRRELHIKDDEPILTKVPVQMVCPSCRSHFTKGTFPDPSPCEAAMQTEVPECCDAQTSTVEHRRTGADVASNFEQEKLIEKLRSELALEKLKNQQLAAAVATGSTSPLRGTPSTTLGSSPQSVESQSHCRSLAKTSSDRPGLAASQQERTDTRGCWRSLRRAFNAFQLTTKRGRSLRLQRAMNRRWRELAAYENYIKRMMFARWRSCTANISEERSHLPTQKDQIQKNKTQFLSAPQTQLDGSSHNIQHESHTSELNTPSSPLKTTQKQLEQRKELEGSTDVRPAFSRAPGAVLLGQARHLTLPGKHKIRDRDLVKSPFVASASHMTPGHCNNSSSVTDHMQNPQVPMETMWGTKYHKKETVAPPLANSRSAGSLVRSPCIHVVKQLSLELDAQGTGFGRSRSLSSCAGSRHRLPPSLSPVASPMPSPARVGSQGIRSGCRAGGC
eukprot:TRINITY_DN276_c0_g1_i1.p1 TRINITY_DN276_c0_g1~~TRINITY_DN276_c0_g1_i1.p1  ORF type:complete len:625 (-),score=94.71 TRINITY_DN276_c0_g1_i1:68-1942(-)